MVFAWKLPVAMFEIHYTTDKIQTFSDSHHLGGEYILEKEYN